jgi:hypothetical protein
MYLGVKHFKYFLEGRAFTIFTDHKPLTFSMMKTAEPGTARQQRHLAFVSEFTTDIQHVSGKDNVVADALSRQIHSTSLGVDFAKVAEEQHTDPDIRLLQESDTGLIIREVEYSPGIHLLCDISQVMVRPLCLPHGRGSYLTSFITSPTLPSETPNASCHTNLCGKG